MSSTPRGDFADLTLRSPGPHHGQPVLVEGPALGTTPVVGILVHGRGATAEGILELAHALRAPHVTWLAPQAAAHSWYPNRFVAPLVSNEPWLSSALAALGDLVRRVAEAGIARDRIFLAGFSQGACLTLEFVVRNPGHYGGVGGLSGGLIGPPGTVWPRDGALDRTPVFLGCSDVDDHIPAARVLESADVLRANGADVTDVLYPGMGHTVNRDELDHMQRLIDRLA
jgi:phospholipase/carboxylesterase